MIGTSWAQPRMTAARAALPMTLSPAASAATAGMLGTSLNATVIVGGGLLIGAMLLVEPGGQLTLHRRVSATPERRGRHAGILSRARVRDMGTEDVTIEQPGGAPQTTDRPAGNGPFPVATGWTFLTNHALVLLAIARDRDVTLREVAARVGITERSAQNIVADLVNAGYLTRTRRGRRNSYTIPANRPMRHPLNAGHDLDELLALLVPHAPIAPKAPTV